MRARPALRSITALVAAAAAGWATGSVAIASPTPDPSRFTATAVQPAGAPIQGAKTISGRLAQSDPALLSRTDTAPVNVMVKLDLDGAASYRGQVKGLAATSPKLTGRKLQRTDRAVAAYLSYAGNLTRRAGQDIAAKVPGAKVGRSFTVAYGGLSVRLPASQAKSLLSVPGVVAVQPDSLQHVDSTAVPEYIGATKVWPSLGGSTKAGQGVIVGIIDSGIWPEHPSFADNGITKPAGGPWACQFGDGTDPTLGAPFACNDKLIGAYNFTQTYVSINGARADEYCNPSTLVCSVRDSEGHGTHVASTAAGSAVAHAPIFGIERGPISGIAPGASVISYRVCLAKGCYGSDSAAAVEQAILDGVNVINFSISGGKNPYTDPVELAFLDAFAAGISVSASAGNSGPGAQTSDHASPWITTVAASTSDRHYQSTLNLTADNGDVFSKIGSTLTAGVTGLPVVRAQDVPGYTAGSTCGAPFAAGSVTGKVVVCERGGTFGGAAIGRAQKGYNALQGGAAGMILYNVVLSDTETDNHWLPAIHLEGPNDELLTFLSEHTGITATWATGQEVKVRGDVMAGFSSRGPLGDWLKPDITAPGVQILAGNTPTPIDVASGPPGQLFQAIAGTSMSSPHVAGSAALVKAAHSTWSPAQIKSALTSASAQDVLKEDGVTASDPFDRGSGGLRVNLAVNALLTLDESAADYADAATDVLNRVDLNVASIQANPLPGTLTTYRTFTNATNKKQSFKAFANDGNGLKIKVSPTQFTVPARGTVTLAVSLDGTAAGSDWVFGRVVVSPNASGAPRQYLPVAAKKGDGVVSMTHACTPTEVGLGEASHCTVSLSNLAQVAAPATLSLVAPKKVAISNVSAPATATSTGFTWSGTLAPAIPPQVTSVSSGGSPAGYLPLSAFGIAPIAGVGDETLTNFNVPAFQYGGETYSSVGVDSNGYVVVGGGTSADNNCCDLRPIPNVARPNNVVAPFWTDLNAGIGTGAVRIGELTDGVNRWTVVDWAEVSAFGAETVKNSFEVWILQGSAESVTMALGTLGGPHGQPLLQGAENRDGSSGASFAGVANTDWTVNTTPPAPGGSVTVTYDASSGKAGTYVLAPQATTPLVKGTISTSQTITVGGG